MNNAVTQHTQDSPNQSVSPFSFGTIEFAAVFFVLFTAAVGLSVKRHWRKRENFFNACDEFKSTFDKIIHALESIPRCDREILQSEFPSHEKAMIKFRDHLKGKKLRRFNEAWEQYKTHHTERTDVPLLGFIGTEYIDPTKASDPKHHEEVDQMNRNNALALINKALSFAKY